MFRNKYKETVREVFKVKLQNELIKYEMMQKIFILIKYFQILKEQLPIA